MINHCNPFEQFPTFLPSHIEMQIAGGGGRCPLATEEQFNLPSCLPTGCLPACPDALQREWGPSSTTLTLAGGHPAGLPWGLTLDPDVVAPAVGSGDKVPTEGNVL